MLKRARWASFPSLCSDSTDVFTFQKSLKIECDNLKSAQEHNRALIARLEADLEVKLLRADRSSRFGGSVSVGPTVRGRFSPIYTCLHQRYFVYN